MAFSVSSFFVQSMRQIVQTDLQKTVAKAAPFGQNSSGSLTLKSGETQRREGISMSFEKLTQQDYD